MMSVIVLIWAATVIALLFLMALVPPSPALASLFVGIALGASAFSLGSPHD
jgi:hypothetical protein